MAGVFITFLVEYLGHRVAHRGTEAVTHDSSVGLYVLEAGIIFHSISKSSLRPYGVSLLIQC
jgi:hypothetical protein